MSGEPKYCLEVKCLDGSTMMNVYDDNTVYWQPVSYLNSSTFNPNMNVEEMTLEQFKSTMIMVGPLHFVIMTKILEATLDEKEEIPLTAYMIHHICAQIRTFKHLGMNMVDMRGRIGDVVRLSKQYEKLTMTLGDKEV